MSTNSGTGIKGINIGDSINSFTRFLTHNNMLDFVIRGNSHGIPYAFMGLVTLAAGTFTYVTYKDYSDEIASGISETLDSVQSSELFIPSKEADPDSIPLIEGVSEESTSENTNNLENSENIDSPKEEKDESKEEPKEETKEEPKEEAKEENKDESKEEKKEEKKDESKEEKKDNEPGEKYKMGGTKNKRRKRKISNKRRK